MAMLEVRDLEVSYGLIRAIRGVSFAVNEGEIVALIGANGAGKTTIMHAVAGLIPKRAGQVSFLGNDITNTPAYRLVPMGMAQVPEGRRIFQELTVEENLRLGAYTRKDKKEIDGTLERLYGRFAILRERSGQVAGTLSGGEQQMLAMGRALMSQPQLLMLDEPSMGLAPILVQQIFDIVRELHRAGTTILLVEQNAEMALKIANRAYVLETGGIAMSGDAATLANDDSVRRAYLGG